MSEEPIKNPNLTEANLTEADLTEANLTDADFTDATLHRTILKGADLTDADFTKADLQGANLSSAILLEASFEGANLEDSILEHAQLSGVSLRGVSLRRANLRSVDLGDADLTNTDLTEVKLGPKQGCAPVEVIFIERFPPAVERRPPAEDLFAACEPPNLRGATLVGANLTDANLAYTELVGVSLDRAILDGADLRGAKITDADLTTICRPKVLPQLSSGVKLQSLDDLPPCHWRRAYLRWESLQTKPSSLAGVAAGASALISVIAVMARRKIWGRKGQSRPANFAQAPKTDVVDGELQVSPVSDLDRGQSGQERDGGCAKQWSHQ